MVSVAADRQAFSSMINFKCCLACAERARERTLLHSTTAHYIPLLATS